MFSINFRLFPQFTADVAQTPFDVDIMLEIVVGTIPLEGHYSLPDYPAATAGMGKLILMFLTYFIWTALISGCEHVQHLSVLQI